MRHPARTTLLFTLLLCAARPAFAQNASDFYLDLLRRGTSFVEAGQYADAAMPLRLAAFGLVETIDRYETALVYLTVAQDRLGNQDGARDSIRRIVAAERVERKLASLQLPPAIRTAFDGVAKKYLSPADVSALASGGPIVPPQRSQPKTTTRPAPSSPPQPPAQETAQDTTTTTQPQTTTPEPAPATTNTTKPSPPPTSQPKAEAKPEPRKPEPKPVETKPAETKPAPAVSQPSTPPPPAVKPPAQPPAKTQPAIATVPPAQPKTKSPAPAMDGAARLEAAERALSNAQLTEARRLYREVLQWPGLDRDSTLRVAEGFYRARDFAGALAAFKVLGALKRGEEAYGYYHAVSLYETGAFDAAKRELAAAMPYIEMSPDVERYRAKIEAAH